VTISCQLDGLPPQPVRPWKSGRVHLAECSKVVVELPYSTEFGRESRKFASGVRKYGKFDSSSSRMRVIYHNWSATKQRPHPQSVAEISHHSVLSGDRIRQCETSSGSRHKDTDQCL